MMTRRPPAGPAGRSHPASAGTELTIRFEHEAAPLRDIMYRHAFRIAGITQHRRSSARSNDEGVRGFHSFRRDTNVHAWLLRILINTYISDYRKKRRQPVQYSIEEFAERRLAGTYASSVQKWLRSAEDQALDSLPDSDIKSAMQQLPQQFRDVVYYADVEGLRYREIASITKTPAGTVASQLHRGRRQLRKLLGDGVSGSPTIFTTA